MQLNQILKILQMNGQNLEIKLDVSYIKKKKKVISRTTNQKNLVGIMLFRVEVCGPGLEFTPRLMIFR